MKTLPVTYTQDTGLYFIFYILFALYLTPPNLFKPVLPMVRATVITYAMPGIQRDASNRHFLGTPYRREQVTWSRIS